MKYLLRPLFFLTLLTLTGCLDENSKDSLDEQHTYTTDRDVYVNAVATLYNYIGSDKDSEGLQGTYRGVYDYNTFTTDEAIIPVRGGDWYDGGFGLIYILITGQKTVNRSTIHGNISIK